MYCGRRKKKEYSARLEERRRREVCGSATVLTELSGISIPSHTQKPSHFFFLSYKSSVSPDTFRFHKYSNQDMSCTLCYYYYYYYYVLSPLCKVFAILCPKQAMILGYLLLQLFCSYSVSYM